jgi:hypothetical protein
MCRYSLLHCCSRKSLSSFHLVRSNGSPLIYILSPTPVSQTRRIMDYPVLLHRYHIRLYGRVILSRMAIQIKTLSKVRAHILQRPSVS